MSVVFHTLVTFSKKEVMFLTDKILKSASDLFKGKLSENEMGAIDLMAENASRMTKFKQQRGLTNEEFADLIGMDPEVLESFESGDYDNIAIKGDNHE